MEKFSPFCQKYKAQTQKKGGAQMCKMGKTQFFVKNTGRKTVTFAKNTRRKTRQPKIIG